MRYAKAVDISIVTLAGATMTSISLSNKSRIINWLTLVLISLTLLISILLVVSKQSQEEAAIRKPQADVQPLREIPELVEFLERCFGRAPIGYSVKALTKPGDNYNSMLQAIEVKMAKINDSDIETLQLVTKTVTHISARKSRQFLNEANFYSKIIPTLEEFERTTNMPESEKIDAFVRYFGFRLSLNPNAEHADSNAILLLENAKSLNFVSSDRWDSFNEEQTLAILKRLAKMHALVIAVRRLQPDVFAANIQPHLHTVYTDSFIETLIKVHDKFAAKLLIDFPDMTTSVHSAITKQLNHCKEFVRNTTRAKDTPYTTIYHRDLWSKNIMIKSAFANGTTGSQIQVKILDFQAYHYESFVFDLTFFLLMNAGIDDLTTKFTSFIRYYHTEFLKTMQLVGCPLDDYSYERMWNEVKEKAKLNLFNIYLYLAQNQIAFLKIGTNSESKSGDIYLLEPTPPIIRNRWKCINDIYIENGFI